MAFGQGVVDTRGYRSCPAMECRAPVRAALTHKLPFFGAQIRAVFARAIEQRSQRCAHIMTPNARQIQLGWREA